MGLFSKLKDAIFSKPAAHKTAPPKTAQAPDPKAEQPAPVPPAESTTTPESSQTKPVPEQRLTAAELAASLDRMERAHPEDLAWRKSIVDLMKLVDMDSSYNSRKELAIDLGYKKEDIESKGSAEMNVWLQKEVMKKLSEDTDGDLSVA